MAHRLIPSAEAEAEGVTREALVEEAIPRVPYRRADARAEPLGHGIAAVVSDGGR
jgi:hypothetical protein